MSARCCDTHHPPLDGPATLAEAREHFADLAEGGIIVDDDGDKACADTVVLASEVYTLADVLEKVIKVVEKHDQLIGLLTDMIL